MCHLTTCACGIACHECCREVCPNSSTQSKRALKKVKHPRDRRIFAERVLTCPSGLNLVVVTGVVRLMTASRGVGRRTRLPVFQTNDRHRRVERTGNIDKVGYRSAYVRP